MKFENQTESSSYNMSENSRSETVLLKIKPIPAEDDLIPPKTYKAIVANKKPLVASPPARTLLNAGVFTTILIIVWPAQFTKKI